MKGCIELLNALRANPDNKKYPHNVVPDMAIISIQAVLMQSGGAAFQAMKAGDLGSVLAGVVALAYGGLEALASSDSELQTQNPDFHNDYVMLTIMRQLSKKIANCASGEPADYSELVYYCAHLTTDFINADFDKAMAMYHTWQMNHIADIQKQSKNCIADLTASLYE